MTQQRGLSRVPGALATFCRSPASRNAGLSTLQAGFWLDAGAIGACAPCMHVSHCPPRYNCRSQQDWTTHRLYNMIFYPKKLRSNWLQNDCRDADKVSQM